jgi:hypothetical protein
MSYHPQTILSSNTKTSVSLNLPRAGHCRPTPVCSFCCYGKSGPIAFGNSTRKQKWVSEYLKGSDISELMGECVGLKAIRLSAVGDLLPDHLGNLRRLAEGLPGTQFWGMTRKTDIASEVNGMGLPNLSLLVSVDASSPEATWNYDGALCYGPRRVQDRVPLRDKRIVTIFPYHFSGKMVGNIPKDKRDCPAVRHSVKGCYQCGRCWNW